MIKTGKHKRKPLRIRAAMAAAVILLAAACATTGTAQAKEETFASHGSLVYENGREKIAWYAEDLLLLKEEISSIPEQSYDPVSHTHNHFWIYQDINEKTHTRHCEGCGNTLDTISSHTAVKEENCVISYKEKTYPGRRYTCECGWQWMHEAGHTFLYEPIDAVNHRCRCALDDTAYCLGYEPVIEEHYAYCYSEEDEAHREKICLDCGYREEIAPAEPALGEPPELPEPPAEDEPSEPTVPPAENEPPEPTVPPAENEPSEPTVPPAESEIINL